MYFLSYVYLHNNIYTSTILIYLYKYIYNVCSTRGGASAMEVDDYDPDDVAMGGGLDDFNPDEAAARALKADPKATLTTDNDEKKAGDKYNPFAEAPLTEQEQGGNDWFAQSALNAANKPKNQPAVVNHSNGNPVMDSDGSISMFWTDAYESPHQPGKVYHTYICLYINNPLCISLVSSLSPVLISLKNIPNHLSLSLSCCQVYLFGRVKTGSSEGETASCCVVVENIERNLFVLPRQFKLDDANDENSVTDQEVTHTLSLSLSLSLARALSLYAVYIIYNHSLCI